MAKRDMKGALGASLKAEEEAVKSRFEKAETALARKGNPAGREPEEGEGGRVIRDSFTMPASDYGLIPVIRKRCMKAGLGVSKSEVLRAGLKALESMSEKQLREVVSGLRKVKTGRPATK